MAGTVRGQLPQPNSRTDVRTRRPRFSVGRVYDSQPGGYRVLVDRLWPRGLKKDDAVLDEWAKEVAPSAALRRWYGHDPDRFDEFARRYREELGQSRAAAVVDHLLQVGNELPVALLTATRDAACSGARVLADHLTGVAAGRARS